MKTLSATLGLVLPSRCAACRAWGRAPLCESCERDVRWIRDPLCRTCGLPTRQPLPCCRSCRSARLPYDHARAAAAYAGPVKEAVKAFKLLGERRLGRSLAHAMAAVARGLPADAITWVPGTRRSLNERGFVPAEELARPLARELGLPAGRLLEKIRETADQSGLTRAGRRANQRGAFAPRPPMPRSVLLVDDILTTGATVEACSAALKAGGARLVSVVAFARVL